MKALLAERRSRRWIRRGLTFAILTGAALGIGLFDLGRSGPLWPDAPRYANAGAMTADWLRSGEWTHPYEFAIQNYKQYPAFNIPYHPPGYPGMLGAFFLVAGVSYPTARLFVALCAAAAGLLFFRFHRQYGYGPLAAAAAGLMLITTPDVAHWTRCTMSEVPSLPFVLLASMLFLRWAEGGRNRCIWGACAAMGLAVMCRVTSIGILPGWFLYLLLYHRQRIVTRHAVPAAVLLLAFIYLYVKWAGSYGTYEVGADGKSQFISMVNLQFFVDVVPRMMLWGTTLGAVAALVLRRFPSVVADAPASPLLRFWICWLIGFTAFKLAVATTPEVRHFFGVLPALAGLAAALAAPGVSRRVGPVLVALVLAVNLGFIANIPEGLVGYEAVAEMLAEETEPGNVLLACWEDQDLIFRFRSADPQRTDRLMLRSDRVLAVRVSEYAGVAAVPIAETPDDVVAIVRKGRARFVVTIVNVEAGEDRTVPEMQLAHRTMTTRPDDFALLATFPLKLRYGGGGCRGTVHLWRYRPELPAGPSELPMPIPTSGMEIPGGE